MKKLLFVFVVMTLALQSPAQFTKATLQATGLTCAMCNNAINKALQKVSFVSSVQSDIKNASFNIAFRPGAAVDIDVLRKAVEDAGFSIGNLKMTGIFNDIKITGDQCVKMGNDNFHFLNTGSGVLDGEKTIMLLDKDFLTAKEFKKYSAATKTGCPQSGKEGNLSNTKVYHVTI